MAAPKKHKQSADAAADQTQKGPAQEPQTTDAQTREPQTQGPPALSSLSRDDINRLNSFADYLQRLNLAEYIKLTQKPKRMIGLSFINGVARGFGMAVGFTLLGAIGIYILNQLNVLNLPVIGDFIAQILEYVELARGVRI